MRKRDEFEPRVLELWMKTRIPMTRANIQYWTGASRRRVNRWLEQLVIDGVLDVDLDRGGDMRWTVVGAARPIDGPTSFDEHERREKIREQARRRVRARAAGNKPEPRTDELPSEALILKDRAKQALQKPEGGKSLLWSGGLSLLLGPVGWLYAGSFREAVPAALIYLAIAALIPKMLLMPIAGVALPLSAIAGLIYAWQYNRHGERMPLLLGDKDDEDDDGDG